MASQETEGSTGADTAQPPLWEYVTKLEKLGAAGGAWKFKCNLCGETRQGSYSRVRAHLLGIKGVGIAICKSATTGDKQKMKRLEEAYEEKKAESNAEEVALPCEAGVGFKKRKGSSTPIERAFGVAIRDQLDQEIARMFYTGGLPFNLARNPHYFRAFQFAAANKIDGYVPPGYNKLRTTLLQNEKENVHRQLEPLRSTWKEKGVTIVSDGWSDPTRKPLINFMATSVNKPREQVSDARALRDLASTLATSIRVHNFGSVTPSLFVSSLISRFGKKKRRRITESDQIQWKDISLHASSLFMTFQGPCSMLGHMNPGTQPPKVLVKRKRSRSTLKEKKVKPKEIKDTVSKEKTDTEKIVATMFDILKTNKNVCLGNIVLNRNSFAQTVENLFALSFLVKDGRVVITVDEKGSHYVSPRNAPSASMISSGKVAYFQFMFKFGFVDWKTMKASVGGGCKLMPHRMKVDSCGGYELKPGLKEGNSQGATISTTKMESRNQQGSHEIGNREMFIFDKPQALLVYSRRGRRRTFTANGY